MGKRLSYMIVLIISTLMFTGCWDSTELNDRHVVLEMAFDKAESTNNDDTEDYYEITYTIPDIKKLSGEESLAEDVKTAVSSVTPTVLKSIDQTEAKLQDTLTFSHVKAILFGEELLREPKLFENAINSLTRNIEFSRGTSILAVQGKANKITQGDNYQNPILGLYIMKYFNNTDKGQGNVKHQSLGNLIREVQDTGVTTMPIIANTEENEVKIGGAAVIKDYQLAGWLTENEVIGMNLVNGDVNKMPVVVQYKGEYLTYTIDNKRVKIKFNNKNEFEATVHIVVRGNIIEGLSVMNNQILNKQDINEIEKVLSNKLTNQIEAALEKERQMDADFLEIMLELYRQNPKVWNQYNEQGLTLNDIKIDFEVETVIENTGIID